CAPRPRTASGLQGDAVMPFNVEVFSGDDYTDQAAARIALALPGRGSVVLTGGTTAGRIYEPLAAGDRGWGDLDVFFSDERCVPPDDDASNFGMASRLLFERVRPGAVHRMKGEIAPERAAAEYHDEVSGLVEEGAGLVLLGMGADNHICALFPGSPALEERGRYCVPVDRPDGLGGLTLTPPVVRAARLVLLLVTGESKAEALRRAVAGIDPPDRCPVRVLADHPDVTFLVDDAAASRL
ncbi:MAG: 6-phosphogluconolactonase, partial [Actinomycetota bacterium]